MNNDTRRIAVLSGNGTIKTITAPVPPLGKGMVRLAVKNSLVSPGTELGGWDQLAEQLKGNAGSHEPRPFGYSAAGVVADVGDGVDSLPVGARVAAIGAGYAVHSDVAVVPQNLCVPIPDGVSFASASYAMLMGTALHAVRRGTPSIGEYWVVVGLGLVGLLTARLLQLSGCFVTGIDQHEFRVNLGTRWMDERLFSSADAGLEKELESFTGSHGFDGAVIAFGGSADDPMDTVVRSMKVSPDGHPMGTIVAVGWPKFSYAGLIGAMNNIDLRRASRTGPGYHDETWERGEEYPPVLVRWSTQSNVELCLELVRRSMIDVDQLTTHTVSLNDLETRIPELLEDPGSILGVVFTAD